MLNITKKQRILRRKKAEKGLSLIEASMVLALSAIVVSGVMFYYQSASDSNKTQNTVSEVMSVISAINGLYVGQSSYDGLSDSVLYNSSAVPANYKGATGVINNPFGGRLHVAPNTTSAGGYALLLDGVPQSSCVNIASMNLGTSLQGVGVKVTSMNTNTKSVSLTPETSTSSVSSGKVYSGNLTPANAATLCRDEINS
ncbi:TPA: pilus assembly protein, partial [Escherichia coli]|nr:pilus assembly protein [Escherichia coli]